VTDQHFEDLLISDDAPSQPRDQKPYLQHRISKFIHIIQSGILLIFHLAFHVEYEPGEYALRPYQNELVKHANRLKINNLIRYVLFFYFKWPKHNHLCSNG
jgi:hypothetical protein